MQDARIVVHYPTGAERIVLRTEIDWDRDVEPETREPATGRHCFRIPVERPALAFKPVRRDGDVVAWARGENRIWHPGEGPLDVYPRFRDDAGARVSDVLEVRGASTGRTHRLRVFTPPGYDENVLERCPVVYLHDGPNIFFPGESFSGRDWMLAETLTALDAMQAIPRAIAVAVYPKDRMADYTKPGYGAYGRYLADDLVPWIDARYRTKGGAADRLVMGSSLGGVVSLYLGWEHSAVFGNVACLSSTFGFRDDLADRVAREPLRPLRIYLDSGWPGDNFEVTRSMHARLRHRGYRDGADLHYLAFPHARHQEDAWASRAHIPLQFAFGPAAPQVAGVANLVAA